MRFFNRKPKENPFLALQELENNLRAQGWIYWLNAPPHHLDRFEIIRDGEEVSIMERSNLDRNPQFNVANLWWRPLNNVIDVTPTTELLT